MKVTISLSLSRLVEILLAHSAASCMMTGDDKPLLTKDNETMLRIFVDAEIDRISLELGGIVEGVEQDESGDLRLLSCELDAGVCARVWRRNLETAICAGVMAKASNDLPERSKIYADDCRGIIESIRTEALRYYLPSRISRGA